MTTKFEAMNNTINALGVKLHKNLASSWIFQHVVFPDGVDTDNASQFGAAFEKKYTQYFKTAYADKGKALSCENALTIKQIFMFASIVRGELKASDFTSDVPTQKLITAMAKAADETYHFKAMQVKVKKEKNTTTTKEKKQVKEFVK